jgi:hypothetical protein
MKHKLNIFDFIRLMIILFLWDGISSYSYAHEGETENSGETEK